MGGSSRDRATRLPTAPTLASVSLVFVCPQGLPTGLGRHPMWESVKQAPCPGERGKDVVATITASKTLRTLVLTRNLSRVREDLVKAPEAGVPLGAPGEPAGPAHARCQDF